MPDTAGQCAVSADLHVVGHLNLVIQLDSVLDDRIFQRTPIDGGVGADFDIIANPHPAELRHFQPAAIAIQRQSKAIAADHRAGMHQNATTQLRPMTDGHLGDQPAPRANHRLFANHAVGPHDHASLDDRARFHRTMRANPGVSGDVRVGTDPGGRMNARLRFRLPDQTGGGPGIGDMRVIGHQRRSWTIHHIRRDRITAAARVVARYGR